MKRINKLRPICAALLCASMLAFASGFSSCGKAPVNTNPTVYDRPAQILTSITESTNSLESIVKNHHNAKRAAIKADTTLSKSARKAALTSETESFARFNSIYKRALATERDAANAIKSLAESGGSPQTAIDKIQIISNIVVNELLTSVSDAETRQSLQQLNNLIQQLIGQLKGGK